MVDPQILVKHIIDLGIDLYAGVPDSLIKHFCAAIGDQVEPSQHIITANEGGAIALAAGHYLSTGKVTLVYMQNSGLGNAINPLLSLADPNVYSIPMLLVIGWRGEPGMKDEPQHIRQGEVTLKLLETIGVEYEVMPTSQHEAEATIKNLIEKSSEEKKPVALVVKKGSFTAFEGADSADPVADLMSRESAIEAIMDSSGAEDLIVSTTGMASRELYELRKSRGDIRGKDFLTVGSMGHCSQIALGVSRNYKAGNVFCLDGDGSMLMHMGGLVIIAQTGKANLIHIILNNGAHDSVGGQPTLANRINIPDLARSLGYVYADSVGNKCEIKEAIGCAIKAKGVSLIEVKIAKGNRPDLGRPLETPIANKQEFMNHVCK